MEKAKTHWPRTRGHIKDKIFNLSDEVNCSLIYRPFSEDAFPASLEAEVNELTIVTYTSPQALATSLELIKDRYPLIQSVTLVVGLASSKEDFSGDFTVDKRVKKFSLEKSFEEGLTKVLKELREPQWAHIDIDITLHNHSHIKYFQAGNICITGSQNFSGTIKKSPKSSNYCKNELMLHIYQSEEKLRSISSELLRYLHAHEDEFVKLTKSSMLSNEFSVKETFEQLKQKRLVSACGREKYEDVFKEIDNDYFLEVLHQIEIQEKREKSENRHLPPPQFDVFQSSQSLFESDELDVESLISVIGTIEEVFEFSELSERITEKHGEVTEAFDNLISRLCSEDIQHLLLNNDEEPQTIELDITEAQYLFDTALKSKIDTLADEYLKDYYIDILQHCNDVLKSHNFHDPSDYIKSNKSEIVDELLQTAPDLLPRGISEYYDEPDQLVPIANDYVDSMCMADIGTYAPRHFRDQLESVRDSILEFNDMDG